MQSVCVSVVPKYAIAGGLEWWGIDSGRQGLPASHLRWPPADFPSVCHSVPPDVSRVKEILMSFSFRMVSGCN